MKRKVSMAALTIIMALAFSNAAFAATGPAYPEVPVSERTSNLAANQNFVDLNNLRRVDSSLGVWRYYNMYGNPVMSARLAGGITYTDSDGIAIETAYQNVSQTYGWRQDPEIPVNNNGISNWYYGNDKEPFNICSWDWMPDQDNIKSTKKAYCFNEYGYLYVNTITPDGFIVNERGQMITEDGTLVEHEYDARTHEGRNRNAYLFAPIGFMRQKYFTVCNWNNGYEGNPACLGKCLFGLNK